MRTFHFNLFRMTRELNQQSIEAESNSALLQVEVEKRRSAEDKLRSLISEYGEVQTVCRELQTNYDKSVEIIKSLEAKHEKFEKDSKAHLECCKKDLRDAVQKLRVQDIELQARPPVDFGALSEKIGIYGVLENEMVDLDKDGADRPELIIKNDSSVELSSPSHLRILPWSEVELRIVDSIRKASSEAAECRVKENEVCYITLYVA